MWMTQAGVKHKWPVVWTGQQTLTLQKGWGISEHAKRRLDYELVLYPIMSTSNYVLLRNVAEPEREKTREVKYGVRTKIYLLGISKYTNLLFFAVSHFLISQTFGVASRIKLKKKFPETSKTFRSFIAASCRRGTTGKLFAVFPFRVWSWNIAPAKSDGWVYTAGTWQQSTLNTFKSYKQPTQLLPTNWTSLHGS
jgi:hypothetical protein